MLRPTPNKVNGVKWYLRPMWLIYNAENAWIDGFCCKTRYQKNSKLPDIAFEAPHTGKQEVH